MESVKKQSLFFIHKKISLNLEELDEEIVTDEKWTSFIIEQILSNALKYTKEGSISHLYEGIYIIYRRYRNWYSRKRTCLVSLKKALPVQMDLLIRRRVD